MQNLRLALPLLLLVPLAAAPVVIDDLNHMAGFEQALTAGAKTATPPDGEKLARALPGVVGKKIPLPAVTAPGGDYESMCRSVGVIAGVYNCGKCANWHLGSTATAWAASADGIFVTNHHVIAGAVKQAAMGVRMLDGKVYPVVEVLSCDPVEDIAVIRVAGAANLRPLPVLADAPVGTAVRILSHPENRFYTYTEGKVSRYYRALPRREKTADAKRPAPGKGAPATAERPLWMTVTAEYAAGSSGGPVFDERGCVLGMVSSTESLYYGGKTVDGKAPATPFQMVIRNCVPGSALAALLPTAPAK